MNWLLVVFLVVVVAVNHKHLLQIFMYIMGLVYAKLVKRKLIIIHVCMYVTYVCMLVSEVVLVRHINRHDSI